MKITVEQFKAFQRGGLKIKVINQESIFKNETFPVMSIGLDSVTCFVSDDGDTHSFYFNEIEFIEKERFIEDGFGGMWNARCPNCKRQIMQIVRPGKVQCPKCD